MATEEIGREVKKVGKQFKRLQGNGTLRTAGVKFDSGGGSSG